MKQVGRPPLCEQARANCADNPWLRRLITRYRRAASEWMRYGDHLPGAIPSPEIRSWGYANVHGCPVHGGTRSVFTYRIDRPGRAICRIGGEEYPNADFPDADGRGWLDQRRGSPTEGERFTFTADAYRYLWLTLRNASFALSLAYLLHEDTIACRACVKILDAMSAVYPQLDNRTCEAWAPRTWHVPLSEHIQEGIYFRALAYAYLFIRESAAVDGGSRERIESGLLGYAGRLMRRIHADHPTLQVHNTAAFLLQGVALCGRAIGDEDLVAYAAGAVDGLLANGIWPGGFWNEGAVGYHAEVTRAVCFLAEAILPIRDLYQDARFRRMVDFLFDIRSSETGACLALGDTFADVDYCSFFAPVARQEWHDVRYVMNANSLVAPALADAGRHGSVAPALGDFDTVAYFLTRPIRAVLGSAGEPRAARVRPGASSGVTVLRQPTDNRWLETMLYYGAFCVGQTHGHSDRLSLSLFGQGRAWLEEIGQTDGYLLPVYAGWCQNTTSHATVMVDSRRQEPNPGGRLHCLYQGEGLSLADASADEAYVGRVSIYRRCVLLMSDPLDKSAYVLDLFRVRGGTRHEYSVHASASTFQTEGITLCAPQTGTLEGRDIPLGDATGFDASAIMSYRGSGYQFLAGPASGRADRPWRATWRDGTRGLMFAMPGGDEVIAAEGRRFLQRSNGPRDRFTYLLVRREGAVDLASDFVAVLEAFSRSPKVRSIRRLDALGGSSASLACSVSRQSTEDYIIHDMDPRAERSAGPLRARGTLALASVRGKETVALLLMDGDFASACGIRLSLGPAPGAEVAVVDEEEGVIYLRGAHLAQGSALTGLTLLIERPDGGAASCEIDTVEGDRVRVRGADLALCRGIVGKYDPDRRIIETRSPLLKLATPGPQARGVAIRCRGWRSPVRIEVQTNFERHAQRDTVFWLALEREPECQPAPGDRFSVLIVAPGDRVRLPSVASLRRSAKHGWRLTATCDVELSLPAAKGRHLWARRDREWFDCGEASGAQLPCARCAPSCDLMVATGVLA